MVDGKIVDRMNSVEHSVYLELFDFYNSGGVIQLDLSGTNNENKTLGNVIESNYIF